ncbi:MAG: T9SS type A sorting domain-containing protein [Paludibacter sp.]|jgi:hypothetical protein
MKKITLLVAIFIAITSSFATTTRWFWYGDLSVGQTWDMGTTANWYDPTTVDPLIPFIVPDNFVSGTTAIFDEKAVEGSDTLKLSGLVTVDSLLVNNTRTYVLRSTVSTYKSDSIMGNVFVKDGPGTFVMDCKNFVTGGTILKAGTLTMEKTTSPNIFGSKLVFQGGTANFASGSASTYPAVSLPIEIPAGITAKVMLNRYSYWSSPISGSGELEIAVGGERCMLAASKSGSTINWNNFTGNVTLIKNIITGVKPGYYGLLLGSTKTFDNTSLESAIATADSMMYNKKVMLKSGAGFAGCSGIRCWNIGELQAENDSSFLCGYGAGNSTTPQIYYMFGGLNTDVVYPGSIIDAGSKGYNAVGLVKVGTGKYTFTSTRSITTASIGVTVQQGTFLVNIPITNPATTTALGRVKNKVMTIKAGAIGGGNGRLTGTVLVDSLGTLVVGCDGIGTLELADTLSGTIGSPLSVHHNGTVIMKVSSKSNHDLITSNNAVTFNGGTLLVKGTNASINDGDTITLISYKKAASSNDSINFKSDGLPTGLSYSLKTDTVITVTTTILTSVLTGLDSIKTTTTYTYRIDLIAKSISALHTVSDNSISVYPNPSVGEFNFKTSQSEIKSIDIINLQGQVISSKFVNSKFTTMNLENLPQGIYYAKIKTSDSTKVEKLMIK